MNLLPKAMDEKERLELRIKLVQKLLEQMPDPKNSNKLRELQDKLKKLGK